MLCEGAAESSKGFLERRAQRKYAALAVAQLLAEYLGMPHGEANVVEVDANFRTTSEKKPISSDISLLPGNDGLWYFGLNLRFDKPEAAYFGELTLYLGVDITDQGFVVKHEKQHRVTELSKVSLDSFMREVYEDLLDNYSCPPSKRRASIGFVNEK